jgi:3-oxoacyl-[acyl-carrier-protein] synthase II
MRREVVITGIGVVSPIGIGCAAFWQSLLEGRTGIGPISHFQADDLPAGLYGEVRDFDPKLYVTPRKSLKIMSRHMQFAVAAARLGFEDAGLKEGGVDPERMGVVLGADCIALPIEQCIPSYVQCVDHGQFVRSRFGPVAMANAYPLGMLRTLPNMAACHVSISLDARGHNNTIHQCEVSGLLAISEAVRVIERGWADVMIAGGTSSLEDPFDWVRVCATEELAPRNGESSGDPRPFDAQRRGQVRGEGCGTFVLESRPHAEARGARIYARVLGLGASCEILPCGGEATGEGLQRAMVAALNDARLRPAEVGHVNAHGLSTRHSDRIEAAAVRNLFNGVAVTAPKSFIGNLGSAGGAVEAAVSVLALHHKIVPPTLNYSRPDPACPLNVIHGSALPRARGVALAVNQTHIGQAAAIVLGAMD